MNETKLTGDGQGRQATEKFFTFLLGEEVFGVRAIKVREINALMPITPVPLTPKFVRGVVNLRGQVVPVVDLRMKLGMEPTPDHDRKCIVVVEIVREARLALTGLLVDAVLEVVDIPRSALRAPPALGGDIAHVLDAIAQLGEQMAALLDADALLRADEVVQLAALAEGLSDHPPAEAAAPAFGNTEES